MSLSHFSCYEGMTYADIKSAGLKRIRMMQINPGNNKGTVDFCMDNVRLIYVKKTN